MSRIGKQPVAIPQGVQVAVADGEVRVKGPKGELRYRVPEPISVAVQDGSVVVSRRDEERQTRALHGLARSLIANMVRGVSVGFERTLELHGTGYRAAKSGRNVVLSVGYSHPVEVAPPQGIDLDVPNPTTLVVRGADKQLVGQTAANIRAVRRPEPYLGKGIRYAGERIRRKVGKAGKK